MAALLTLLGYESADELAKRQPGHPAVRHGAFLGFAGPHITASLDFGEQLPQARGRPDHFVAQGFSEGLALVAATREVFATAVPDVDLHTAEGDVGVAPHQFRPHHRTAVDTRVLIRRALQGHRHASPKRTRWAAAALPGGA